MIVEVARDQRGGRVDTRPVRGLLDTVISRFSPLEIWLFGSRARGTASAESDWDLLVVVAEYLPEHGDPLLSYRLSRGVRTGADVVFRDRADFDEDRRTPKTLAFEASHSGVKLYER